MALECSEDKWKHNLNLCLCVVATLHLQLVEGDCGDDDDNNRKGDRGNACWYELWYFWFIVGLVLVLIGVFVILYCKQQVKQSSGRRGRRRTTPVLTMPTGPPCYEEPGHQPPPYHIAISTRQPDAPPTQQTELPGCIVDVQRADSVASVLSVRAVSNPPPYSPPHTAYGGSRPS